MRPIISRADLLRIAATLGGQAVAVAARSLGYDVEDDVVPLPEADAPTQGTAPVEGVESQPSRDGSIVFWQPRSVEFHDEEARRELAQATVRKELAAELERPWEGSADEPPETPPLSPWRRTGPQLQQALTTEQASRRVDVPALIRLWFRGAHVARLPRRHRRTWVPTLMIVDRPLRLVPFWDDQAMVVRELRGVLGTQALIVRVLADGPLFNGGRAGRLWRNPSWVGMPVLVLGDLGWYGGDEERDAWLRLGRELRRAGQRLHALVPVPRSRWTEPLARDWRAMPWERPTRGAAVPADPGSQEARAARVLGLLGAAMRIEPGLIRVARRILPSDEADVGTEADVWASPELGEMFPEARSIIPEQVEALRRTFCDTCDEEQRQVLAAMRAWHWNCERQPEAWHLEVLAIARAQAGLAEEPVPLAPDDVTRAESFMTWLAGDVRHAPSTGYRAAALRGWCQFVKDQARPLWARDTPTGEALQIIGRRVGGIEIPDADPRLRALAGVAGDGAPGSFLVRQLGEDLEISPDSSTLAPGSVLTGILAADPVIFLAGAGLGERELSLGQRVRVKAPLVAAIELRSDRMRMRIEPLTLPEWATAIGRDPAGLWVEMTINGVGHRMRWIPPGRFLMGSPATEKGRRDNEGPQHEVVVSRGYWLGETPVTQALWQALMDDNPSQFKDPARPVESVSWDGTQGFLEFLNEQPEPTDDDDTRVEEDGEQFRLPTEAEWEYACRAGTTAATYAGDGEAALDAIAWWSRNSENQTHPVRHKQPNAWGLHDMLGNVLEWCMDADHEYSTGSSVLVDPMTAGSQGDHRVYRGGSWLEDARGVRAAYRLATPPDRRSYVRGFRLARGRGYQGPEGEPPVSAGRRSHPLATGCPPAWASRWGQDRRGVFAGFIVGGVEYRMRWIADGTFMMGSPGGEAGRFPKEGPQHPVTITRGFWLGEMPVTQALWQAVMQENPSLFMSPKRPVERVSWEDCQRLCARLEGLIPGLGVRLPTEAEWEFACRAGTSGATYAGGGAPFDAIAWWSGNSEGKTHPVGQKQPNAWGLHDMLGNVWEWCSDGMRKYSSEPAADPVGPVHGDHRVFRGGSWIDDARDVRAAYRNANHPGDRNRVLGFRLARGQD